MKRSNSEMDHARKDALPRVEMKNLLRKFHLMPPHQVNFRRGPSMEISRLEDQL